MAEKHQRALIDRPVTLTINIVVPSASSVLASIVEFITRYQIPIGSTRNLVRRQMSLLAVFACAMCIALVITSEESVAAGSPLHHGPWDVLYTILFLAAGIIAVVYWAMFRKLSKTVEFYLRMCTFALAFTASLGWGLLTVLTVVVFTHEWVRVAPWVFITLYFGRALGTYIEYIDLRAIAEMKSALHDI